MTDLRKAFKYRIYPSKEVQEKLVWTLEQCCSLYNAALQERIDSWRMQEHAGIPKEQRKHIDGFTQINELPGVKEACPELKEIGARVLMDVVQRVDKNYKGFFARVKGKKKGTWTDGVGFPRYQSKKRYDSFTYPDAKSGWKLEGNRLQLTKIGDMKIVLHRPISGTVKTCTIKRELDQWYVIFSCVVQPEYLPESSEEIGIDVGLEAFLTDSNGNRVENPRFLRKSEEQLTTLHQQLSRCVRGSNRYKATVQKLARKYRKIRNQRRDFLHKEARKLVNVNQTIVVEELQPKNMSARPAPKQDENGMYVPNGASRKSGLNKSILDASWGMFFALLAAKASSGGREFIAVSPHGTSQMCSGCGKIVKKDLSERWHNCECGLSLHRDHNAAINILHRRVHPNVMAAVPKRKAS